MPSFDYELTRKVPVTVTFSTLRPSRGRRDSLGVPQEPDDEADVEIESIKDAAGNELVLTEEESQEIAEATHYAAFSRDRG